LVPLSNQLSKGNRSSVPKRTRSRSSHSTLTAQRRTSSAKTAADEAKKRKEQERRAKQGTQTFFMETDLEEDGVPRTKMLTSANQRSSKKLKQEKTTTFANYIVVSREKTRRLKRSLPTYINQIHEARYLVRSDPDWTINMLERVETGLDALVNAPFIVSDEDLKACSGSPVTDELTDHS
jgi:hypothetical protein